MSIDPAGAALGAVARQAAGLLVAPLISRIPEPPADLDLFLAWIGIDRPGFLATIDRHRSKTAWERGADGAWRLKAPVWELPAPANAAAVRLGVTEPCRFRVTRPRDRTVREDRYYLLERGFVDGVAPRGLAETSVGD